MKKALFAIGLVALLAAPAFAETTSSSTSGKTSLGLDFEMPYGLRSEGNTVNARGALNLGIDGRWWTSDNLNFGARLAFDLENKGISREIFLTPGVQYHFMDPKAMVRPFVRADLPVILRGAINTDVPMSPNKQDVGIAGGLGVVLNLGELVGVQNLMVRYDFDFGYNFGLGPALNLTYLNFFKIGVDYRF